MKREVKARRWEFYLPITLCLCPPSLSSISEVWMFVLAWTQIFYADLRSGFMATFGLELQRGNNAHMRCSEGQAEKEPMRKETLRETELKLSATLSYHMKFSIPCIGG